jgi:small membrane protein
MSPIQLLLIPLIITVVVYFRRLRSRLLDNLIVLTLGAAGVLMVMMPQWTNLLARSFGVTRGADLIMYIGWIGIAFVCLIFYSKFRGLESQIVNLVRAQAIENALRPPSTLGPPAK